MNTYLDVLFRKHLLTNAKSALVLCYEHMSIRDAVSSKMSPPAAIVALNGTQSLSFPVLKLWASTWESQPSWQIRSGKGLRSGLQIHAQHFRKQEEFFECLSLEKLPLEKWIDQWGHLVTKGACCWHRWPSCIWGSHGRRRQPTPENQTKQTSRQTHWWSSGWTQPWCFCTESLVLS